MSKDTEDSNSTINQLDLIHIYRTLHLTIGEYTFSPQLHGGHFT